MAKFTKIRELPSKIKIISLKKDSKESLEEEVEKASGPDFSDITAGGAIMPGLAVGGIRALEDTPQAPQEENQPSNMNRERTREETALYNVPRERTEDDRKKYNPSINANALPERGPNMAEIGAARRNSGFIGGGQPVNQAGIIRTEAEESPLRESDEERQYRSGEVHSTKRRSNMF